MELARYGIDDRDGLLSFHCFTTYVKATFFRGTSLLPLPSLASRDPKTRWLEQPSKLRGDPLL